MGGPGQTQEHSPPTVAALAVMVLTHPWTHRNHPWAPWINPVLRQMHPQVSPAALHLPGNCQTHPGLGDSRCQYHHHRPHQRTSMHHMHLRLLHQHDRGTQSSRPHTCHQSRSRCRCQRWGSRSCPQHSRSRPLRSRSLAMQSCHRSPKHGRSSLLHLSSHGGQEGMRHFHRRMLRPCARRTRSAPSCYPCGIGQSMLRSHMWHKSGQKSTGATQQRHTRSAPSCCPCGIGQSMLRSHMLRLSRQNSTHATRQSAPHSRRWGRQTKPNSSHLLLRSSQLCTNFHSGHTWFREEPYKPSDGRPVWHGLRAFPRTLHHRRHNKRTTNSSRSHRVAPTVLALRRLISSLRIATVLPHLLSSRSLRATSPATRQDSHCAPNNQRALIAGRRRCSRRHSGRNTRVHGSGRTVTVTVTATSTTTTATLGRETIPMDRGVRTSGNGRRGQVTRFGPQLVGDTLACVDFSFAVHVRGAFASARPQGFQQLAQAILARFSS